MTTTIKTSKHTPGPWLIREEDHVLNAAYTAYRSQHPANEVDLNADDEIAANARLISLAWMLPEIVEALTKAQELMLYNGWAVSTNPRYSEFYAQVKDVLARYHEQEESK